MADGRLSYGKCLQGLILDCYYFVIATKFGTITSLPMETLL